MRFRFMALPSLVAVLSCCAAAQAAPRSITLPQALELAAAHNPEAAAAALNAQAAHAQVRQQHLLPNPELAYSQEDAGKPGRSQSLQLSGPLELGGKRAARVGLAQQQAQAAELGSLAARAQVRAQTALAFFDLLLAQEHFKLAQASVQLAQQAAQAAGQRVAAGKISPVEHSRALAAQAMAQAEAAQAQSQWRSAQGQLAAMLGQDGGQAEDWQAQGILTKPQAAVQAQMQTEETALSSLPPLPILPSWARLLSALDAAPTLQAAQSELAQSQAQLRLARSARWPDVTLSVGVKRNADATQPHQQLLLGAAFPLPLFDRQQGAVQAALAQQAAAGERQRASSAQARQALLQAYENFQAAATQSQLLQSQGLPAAYRAYRAAGIGFAYGKFSFLELLDAQRSYLAVQSQLLQAQGQAYRAAALIEGLLAQPLSALLPAVNERP